MNTFSIKSPGPVAPGRRLRAAHLLRSRASLPVGFRFADLCELHARAHRGHLRIGRAYADGQRGLKGFYLRARNSSAAARIFTATAKLVWDAERSQANLADVVERDWKAAHDRAKASLELRLELAEPCGKALGRVDDERPVTRAPDWCIPIFFATGPPRALAMMPTSHVRRRRCRTTYVV